MADKSFGLKQINMIGVGTPTVESSTDLVVNTNGSERVRIDSSGNIGIGTNNPTGNGSETSTHIHATNYPILHLTNSATGTSASDGSELTLNNDGSLILRNRENSFIRFDTNGSERLRIQSAGGISFNGDTAAANALDDYEEGTWDPNYSFGGTAHTSIVSAGTYIKTGGMVFVTGYLYTNNSSTYSGTATITGLPFSIPSGMRYRGAFTVGQIRRFNEDMPNIKLYPGDNGSTISMFRQSTNSNGVTELTNAQFNFQSEFNIISFSGSYPVA